MFNFFVDLLIVLLIISAIAIIALKIYEEIECRRLEKDSKEEKYEKGRNQEL